MPPNVEEPNGAGDEGNDEIARSPVRDREGTSAAENDPFEDIEETCAKHDLHLLEQDWFKQQLGKVCSNEVADTYFDFAWENCELMAKTKSKLGDKTLNS